MALLNVECQVTKETYELFLGVAGFVKELRKALDDGFDPTTDATALVTAAVTHLIPAVSGIEKIGDEAIKDRAAFVNAIIIGGMEIWQKAQPIKIALSTKR